MSSDEANSLGLLVFAAYVMIPAVELEAAAVGVLGVG